MITGKDLIDLGYKPGPLFKKALEYFGALPDSPTKDHIVEYMEHHKVPDAVTIPLKEIASDLDIFLGYGNTREEAENKIKVIQTMHKVLKTPTTVSGQIMPDACPAGPMGTIPVGGVVATQNSIHPGFHSADVCCSLMLSKLSQATFISMGSVMDAALKATHFGGGGRPDIIQPIGDFMLLEEMAANPFLSSQKAKQCAVTHLGTQGDGNHFLYLGVYNGDPTIVTHHGSRGVGAMLYKEGMKVAEKYRDKYSPDTLKQNAWIPADSPDGEQYWKALQLVRRWTKQNHKLIHDRIIELMDGRLKLNERFWNEHNFVFREEGSDIYYHAKGATPMYDFNPDLIRTPRIVPLNMAEPILLLEREGEVLPKHFAPHGAGRNYSRSQHKRNLGTDRSDLEIFQQETEFIDARFYSGQIDTSELPSAYKNAQSVREQIDIYGLAKVVGTVQPYGSIMAGNWQRNLKRK